ncbi:hypothetical protein ACOMHN_004974 [Nucella lapillus]
MAESWREERHWRNNSVLQPMVLSFWERCSFHLWFSRDCPKPALQDLEVYRCVTSFANDVIRIRVKGHTHLGFIVKMATASPRTVCTRELRGHVPLSEAVLSGHFSGDAARALGTTVASLHSATMLTHAGSSRFEHLAQQFPTREAMLALIRTYHFERPFDPNNTGRRCHDTVLRMLPEILNNPAVTAARDEARQSFLNDLDCLIHGDLHIEAVMVNGSDIKLVDTEFARLGSCAYDVGLLLATLLAALQCYKHVLHGTQHTFCTTQHGAAPLNQPVSSDHNPVDQAHHNVDASTQSPTTSSEKQSEGREAASGKEQQLNPNSLDTISPEKLEHISDENTSGEQEEVSGEYLSEKSEAGDANLKLFSHYVPKSQAQPSEKPELYSGIGSTDEGDSRKSDVNVKIVAGKQEVPQKEEQDYQGSENANKACSDFCIDVEGMLCEQLDNACINQKEVFHGESSEQHRSRSSQLKDLKTSYGGSDCMDKPHDVLDDDTKDRNPQTVGNQYDTDKLDCDIIGVEQRMEANRDNAGSAGEQEEGNACTMAECPDDNSQLQQCPAEDILLKCTLLLLMHLSVQGYTGIMRDSAQRSCEDGERFQRNLLHNIATFTGCELLAWVVGPPHMDFMDSCPAAQLDCALTAVRLLTHRHAVSTVHDLVRLLV